MKSKKVIWITPLFILWSIISAYGQVTWTSIGPGAGSDLLTMAIQPDNPDVFYVGGDIEGVFKTTDGGVSWAMMNNGIRGGDRPAGVYGIQELVIDPTDYQTIYACTWYGLFKSADGARNWTYIFPLPLTEEGMPVSYLTVDPVNNQVLYAGIGDADVNDGGRGSIYRSTNGGSAWDLLDAGMSDTTVVHSILIDPTSPQGNRTIFASTDNGIFRSQDNGGAWVSKNNGLPHLNTRRLAAYTAGVSLTLFLTLKTEGDPTVPGSFAGGIYKSTDGGDNWVSINGDLLTYDDDTEAFYDYWKFAVDPSNPDVIFIGTNIGDAWTGVGLYKSTDGGAHWLKADLSTTQGWLDDVWYNNPFVTILKVAPGNSNVVISGQDWVHKSVDAGQTWTQVYTNQVEGRWISRGMELMIVLDFGFDPTNPDVLYIGYDDMGLFRSDDGGQSFTRLDPKMNFAYDGVNSIVVDPITGDVYVGRNGGVEDDKDEYIYGRVFKSTDHGENFTEIPNGLPEGSPVLVMDPASPVGARVIYGAIYGQGVYKTMDGGGSWSSVNTGLGPDSAFAWTLAIAPSDPQTLYLGLNTLYGTGSGGIYKTTDGGGNWTKLTGAPGSDVLSLKVDPANSSVCYAGMTQDYSWTTDGGLYKSTDGGAIWNKIFDKPRVSSVLIHPEQPDVLFAVSQAWWNYVPNVGSGVYRSMDGGDTWELISDGLGHSFVYTARINPLNPDKILVGTHGGGVWVGNDILTTTAIKDEEPQSIPSGFSLEQNYPNPFNPVTEIKYQIPNASEVTIVVYDVLGKEIAKLVDGNVEAGYHSVTWDASNVASGVYLCKLKTGNFVQTRRMVLLK